MPATKKHQWYAVFVPPEPERGEDEYDVMGMPITPYGPSTIIGKVSETRVRQILGSVYTDQETIENTIEQGDFCAMWNVEFYREDKAVDMAWYPKAA